MPEIIRKFQYQGRNELTLPAEREAFTTLKTWLCGIASDLNLPDKNRKHLLIATDEIFTNIASYGYPKGEGKTTVSVEFNIPERELTVTFSDTGVAYNPLEAPPPDITKPLAERPVGGLGVFMVKKLMDSVEYKREDNRNILILKKYLPQPGLPQ